MENIVLKYDPNDYSIIGNTCPRKGETYYDRATNDVAVAIEDMDSKYLVLRRDK